MIKELQEYKEYLELALTEEYNRGYRHAQRDCLDGINEILELCKTKEIEEVDTKAKAKAEEADRVKEDAVASWEDIKVPIDDFNAVYDEIMKLGKYKEIPISSLSDKQLNTLKETIIKHSPINRNYFGRWDIGRLGSRLCCLDVIDFKDEEDDKTAIRSKLRDPHISQNLKNKLAFHIREHLLEYKGDVPLPSNILIENMAHSILDGGVIRGKFTKDFSFEHDSEHLKDIAKNILTSYGYYI